MSSAAAFRRAWLGLLIATVACALGCRDQRGTATDPGKSSPPRTAEIANAGPKDDPAATKKETSGQDERPEPKASAGRNPLAGCQLCHVDIEDEYMPSRHFKETIACTECHGPSEGHLADENNEVKPDEVFARKDVDRLCSECHECSRELANDPPVKSPAKERVCTDCHGSHELKTP